MEDGLCLEVCRGEQLGRIDCANVQPSLRMPDEAGDRYFHCRRSDITFRDTSQVTTSQPQRSTEVDADEREHHRRAFGSIQMTSEAGDLYPRSGYDQSSIRAGLLERTVHALCGVGRLEPTDEISVLDVGCGSGFLLDALRATLPSMEALGIDPSPISCEQAASRFGLQTEQGTLDTVHVGEERFDVVLMLGNLALHPNPQRSLEHVYRALKPGGIVYFDVKNPRSTARLLALLLARTPLTRSENRAGRLVRHAFGGMHVWMPTPWVLRCLADIGFETEWSASVPPRLLRFDNENELARGATGRVWRALDKVDGWRDQRAWMEFVARR